MRFPFLINVLILIACNHPAKEDSGNLPAIDTTLKHTDEATSSIKANQIETGATSPEELLSFSKTLIGIPYKYASTDPTAGFDCSGFITFVFNHFGITVPRSSIEFTNVKREINIEDAKPGDIILFTGTDSTIRQVGHMGIITSAFNGEIQFIHSTSGKANGVTITSLNNYYKGRFVKVIRVFKQNDVD